LIVLKRALFAWLIADGDMHLKNMALLKIAEPGDPDFRTVRMAPLYDAVTTRVFPTLKHDRMALKLNGKDDHLRRSDFRALAINAGLRVADADAAIDDTLKRLGGAIHSITWPKTINRSGNEEEIVREVLALCQSRIEALSS
jgi:serine/threonine-protein kinase HipA